VIVDDPADVDGIKASRALRLSLRALRVDADKKRKALKDGALRLGRAIDFGYNLLTAQTDPVEKRFQDQEDIAERIAAERKRKLGEARSDELSKHTGMVPPPPELGNWPQAQYDAYLSGVKAQAAKAKADAEAAEAAAAPDKEKLKALAVEIAAVKFPELATKEAQQYASAAGTKLCELSAWLMRAAEKL
jgi:hypothetical protein